MKMWAFGVILREGRQLTNQSNQGLVGWVAASEPKSNPVLNFSAPHVCLSQINPIQKAIVVSIALGKVPSFPLVGRKVLIS